MDVGAWLQAAIADARRRGLPELEPFLGALATSTEALRRADFSEQPDAPIDELVAHVRHPRPTDH
jgi:hypothetical protein